MSSDEWGFESTDDASHDAPADSDEEAAIAAYTAALNRRED